MVEIPRDRINNYSQMYFDSDDSVYSTTDSIPTLFRYVKDKYLYHDKTTIECIGSNGTKGNKTHNMMRTKRISLE